MKNKSVVLFAARPVGLELLKTLVANRFEVKAVFTHSRPPKGEIGIMSGNNHIRPEFLEFFCIRGHGDTYIPIHDVQSKKDSIQLQCVWDYRPFDYLICCSYRYHISPYVLALPTIAAINLHRGKLPEYKGAEPIRQAVENGDTTFIATAHLMTNVIDDGEILATTWVYSDANNIEMVKERLHIRFPLLMFDAMLQAEYGREK